MSLKMQSVAFISVQVSLNVIQGFAGTICCPQMAVNQVPFCDCNQSLQPHNACRKKSKRVAHK